MPSLLFTIKALDAIPTPTTEHLYHDTKLPGLALRILPSGKKTFCFLYRLPGKGGSQKLRLGHYPDLTIDDARTLAKEKRRALELGDDPNPKHQPKGIRFETLAAEFIERHCKTKKKSWEADVQRLNAELLPHWRGEEVTKLTRLRIRTLLLAIVDRGAPSSAQAVKMFLSRMFRYGISQGLVQLEGNPVGLIELPLHHKRLPRKLSADEIGRLWAVCEEQTANDQPMIGEQFKLRILTAQRGGEILHMRWTDIDLDAALWTKPFEFRKLPPTCDHRDPHLVPLPPMAITALRTVKAWKEAELERLNRQYAGKAGWPHAPSKWVFSTVRPLKGLDNPLARQHAMLDLATRAKLTDFHPHDIRHWGSTTANATCRRDWVEPLLDHKIAGIAGVYNQYEYMEHKLYVVYTLENAVRAILKMPAIDMPPRPIN